MRQKFSKKREKLPSMRGIGIDTQKKIEYLLSKEFSVRKVAKETGVSKSTVSRILAQIPAENTKKLGGRPSVLTKRVKSSLSRGFETGNLKTTTDAIFQVKKLTDKTVSNETIRLFLRSTGMKAYSKPLKPRLTAVHKKNRLSFARAMRSVPQETWDGIIFTDESKYNLYGPDGNKFVWRFPSNPTLDHHVRQVVKFGGDLSWYEAR